MILDNKVYDILKWCTQVVLPAILTFYGVVGVTLNIPHTEAVMTIGSAFIVMLGTILGISNAKYKTQLVDIEPTGELVFEDVIDEDSDDGK